MDKPYPDKRSFVSTPMPPYQLTWKYCHIFYALLWAPGQKRSIWDCDIHKGFVPFLIIAILETIADGEEKKWKADAEKVVFFSQTFCPLRLEKL